MTRYKDNISKVGGEENREEELTCRECEKYFKTKTGLNIHKTKVHVNNEKNKCKNCRFIFQDTKYIAEHMENCGRITNEKKDVDSQTKQSVIIVI